MAAPSGDKCHPLFSFYLCSPSRIILFNAKTWLHIQDFELDAALNLGILRISRLKKISEYVESLIFKKI